MVIIYLCYNRYMDVVNEIEILETDVRDCNENCERVNCHAILDAIMSSLKLIYDLIFISKLPLVVLVVLVVLGSIGLM